MNRGACPTEYPTALWNIPHIPYRAERKWPFPGGNGHCCYRLYGMNACSYAMVCRMSLPLTMNITISAMLVAWSAMRSRYLEM